MGVQEWECFCVMSSCGAVQVPGCLGVGYPSVWISECGLSVYKHIGV